MDSRDPPRYLTGMTLRRLWPLVVYFAIFGGVGWYIYQSTDGLARALGEAFGTLAIISLIGWSYALIRRKPVNWIPSTLIASLIAFNSMRPQLVATFDAHRFQAELVSVPATQLPTAIASHSDTTLGTFLGRVIAISQEGQARIADIAAEGADPLLDHALEIPVLASRASRDAVLTVLQTKLPIVNTMPSRILSVLDGVRVNVMQFVKTDTTIMPAVHMQVLTGYDQSSQAIRNEYVTYVSAISAQYTHLADLIMYLDTPTGTPTLTSENKLNFQTAVAVQTFQAYATKIDEDTKAIADTLRTSQQRQESLLQSLRTVLN